MPLPASLIDTLKEISLQPYPSVTGLPQPITIRSVAYFIGALLWAWLLLVNFNGWGRLTGKLFRLQQLPASVACSLGIATIIFLGGLLNILHAIYPSVLYALVATGLLLYFLLRRGRPEAYRWIAFWNQASHWSRLLIVIALLILILRVAATVRLGSFNANDDGPAYLIFPLKLLASHHFAFDPFSDRRVISSLGGAYFLQCFVVAPMSLSHIAMADRALGFILLAGALFDIGIIFGLSAFQIALMEFLAYLAPQETINLTFVVLPISLLLGMIWLIWQTLNIKNLNGLRNAILVGVLGGAIIALKSTYLPIVGAYALIPYLMASWETKNIRPLKFSLAAGFGSFSLLMTWMIAMKMMSGTYLFPVLGHGVDYSAYGLFSTVPRFTTNRAIIKVFLQGLVLFVLICIHLLSRTKKSGLKLGLGILIASVLAITAFNYKSGGDFIWRYNFPQFFVAIAIFYTITRLDIHGLSNLRASRLASYAGIVAMTGMIFYYDASGKRPTPFRQIFEEKEDYLTSLRTSLSGTSLSDPSILAEYRAVEAAIPSDGPALENASYPFLFNYHARKIYLMDWPGAASPKPGWPFGQSSRTLADYLRNNSVRYLVYDPAYIAWDNAGDCKALEEPQLYSSELYILFRMAVLANHQLGQLRTQYHAIYDDGKMAVIDLNSPQPNTPGDESVWALNADKDQMCSQIAEDYLAHYPMNHNSAIGVLRK